MTNDILVGHPMLNATLAAKQAELAALQEEVRILEEFTKDSSDLTIDTDRWGRKRYMSAVVNSTVTNCEIRHSCGCCPDAVLQIWPYKKFGTVPIYSKPPSFAVGKQSYGSGYDLPWEDWQKKLLEAHIPQAIIDQVSEHFAAEEQKQKEYDANDEEE